MNAPLKARRRAAYVAGDWLGLPALTSRDLFPRPSSSERAGAIGTAGGTCATTDAAADAAAADAAFAAFAASCVSSGSNPAAAVDDPSAVAGADAAAKALVAEESRGKKGRGKGGAESEVAV